MAFGCGAEMMVSAQNHHCGECSPDVKEFYVSQMPSPHVSRLPLKFCTHVND